MCLNSEIDNYPKAFSRVERKARKDHKCCECRRTIEKGEKYFYESGIWDHGPDSFKTCQECYQIRESFFCDFSYGELWDELFNNIHELNMDKVVELPVNAKYKFLIWLEERNET